MDIDTKDWNNVQDEIRQFTSIFQGLISEYCGFNVSFPLEKKGTEVIMDVTAQFSMNMPEMTNNILMNILASASNLLEKYINEHEQLNIKNLENITRDVSLSFIFKDYINSDTLQQFRLMGMINDLKNIGAKTYEGHPVDIGVLYCDDENIIEQVQSLNIDIIPLPQKIGMNNFFLEEKPLLRLIDNKSLAIAINRDFEVFAIIRKKPDGKSLSYIIESQFSNCAIGNIKKTTSKFMSDTVKDTISKMDLSDEVVREVIENYANKLSKIVNNVQPIEYPNYIYFSVKNKEVNIFTKQEFVISYSNGDWKLRHYNLMFALIMHFLYVRIFEFLTSMNYEEFEQLLNRITTSVLKLSEIIKGISQKGISAIMVIILQNNHSNLHPLTEKDAINIMTDKGFNRNNLKRNFLNPIRNQGCHLNINESDPYLIEAISAIDGAVIMDNYLNIVSFGEIIDIPKNKSYKDTFGTGTKATRYASKQGIGIKISEDGDIYIFCKEKLLLKI